MRQLAHGMQPPICAASGRAGGLPRSDGDPSLRGREIASTAMSPLPDRITAFYRTLNVGRTVFEHIDDLYAERVHYSDPLQDVHDRAGIRASFEKMFARYEVSMSDVVTIGDERRAVSTWIMVLRPSIGPTFRVHGAADFIAEDGKVVLQTDYWDLLGTAMACLPWVQPIYKRVVGALHM